MNKTQSNIFLSETDIFEYYISQLHSARSSLQLETQHDEFGIYCSGRTWKEYLTKLENLRSVQCSASYGYLFDDCNNYIRYDLHSTHITLTLVGDKQFITKYRGMLSEKFELVTNNIEWLYTSDGMSIEIPLQHERMPVEEMYPFLDGRTLNEYYNDYMDSNASILLLIGPPGTGKTTFIRGFLQQTGSSAMVSYDAAVLEKDHIFAQFIEGDKSVMVLEDADMFLKSRKEGNTMMHKFLNVGDGLVTTRNKKLIFSTNLPSISDIDSALVRPGRCYDIIHFNELDQKQAKILADKCGITLKGEKNKWTISDVFFQQNTSKTTERKMGFI